MDLLADVLQPYKELVGSIAAIVTIGQMFSGCFICWDIYKQKGTKDIAVTPFIGGIVMSILNLKFGFILRDHKMIQVNFVGIAINIIYVMVYYTYTQDKMRVWSLMGVSGAVSAALVAYTEYEDPALVEDRFGMVITAFMFYLIASPLFGLKEIIANKSTAGMPFPIILSGTVVTLAWLLYGVILRNKFLVLQNSVALLLCSSQLMLFVIYPSKPTPVKPKAKPKAKKAD